MSPQIKKVKVVHWVDVEVDMKKKKSFYSIKRGNLRVPVSDP